jgi:hypothetical protein
MSQARPVARRTAAPRTVGAGATSPRLGLALLVIATAQLMVLLDATIVKVALPHIQRGLSFPAPAWNGWSTPTRWPSAGCCWRAGPGTCSAAVRCSSPGIMLLALVITLVAIRVRRVNLGGPVLNRRVTGLRPTAR